MSVATILRDTEGRFKKSLEAAAADFATLRTGRANASLLDAIKVDYHGTPTPIQQLGTVGVQEAQKLVITPWDKSVLAAIEKAITKSDLGLAPINDGINIRLAIPPLTQERRKDLVKQLAGKNESAKVALRNIRRDAIDQFKKDEEVTDDEAKRAEKDVQKLLDKSLVELELLQKSKEGELLDV